MDKEIKISDSIFERLQKLAVPLVDTTQSVIGKLLDFYESYQEKTTLPMDSGSPPNPQEHKSPLRRKSRQRGVIVNIGEETIRAISVRELYDKALQSLYQKGYIEKLGPYLPLATSRQRYLIAQTPIHPNGNKFVVPVEYRGYYMEASKDYKNGLSHLRKMLGYCGLKLTDLTNGGF
jgi:hypothetical protein